MGLLGKLVNSLVSGQQFLNVHSKKELHDAICEFMKDNDLTDKEIESIKNAGERLGISAREINEHIKEIAIQNIANEIQANMIDGSLSIIERTRITRHARGLKLTDGEIDAILDQYAPQENNGLGSWISQGIANAVSSVTGDTENDAAKKIEQEMRDQLRSGGIHNQVPNHNSYYGGNMQPHSHTISNDNYMVNVGGRQHGPYTLQQMQGFIQQGRMNKNTQIMIVGKTSWMPAGRDSMLLSLLNQFGY